MTLFFSQKVDDPRRGPDWFGPEPFASLDVVSWKPDTQLVIGPSTPGLLCFPKPMLEWALGAKYRVQAVVRFNPWELNVGRGAGNGFSAVQLLTEEVPDKPIPLVVDQLVPPRTFPETATLKPLAVRSKLLSEFHGREVSINAAVLLPPSYETESERRFPVIFGIPGFGGTHFDAERMVPVTAAVCDGVEFIRVVLDPSCPWGHHVFADSAHNGPWNTALITEFLPEFERQFRTIAKPQARLLTGHSSGGWSSLWLQITRPDVFGGVWSTAPDPVDFRDFQRIDIYRDDENAHRDPQGERRPLVRRAGQVLVWFDEFDRMETVLGYGGQLQSFEAVFSPRGQNRRPLPLWNRETGAIDTAVAKAWEAYDIRLQLERQWPTLGPKLAGKLRVHMGEQDNFYLEGAVRLLKDSLEKLDSDAVVELHPDQDHRSLLSDELKDRIRREMAAAVRESIAQKDSQ